MDIQQQQEQQFDPTLDDVTSSNNFDVKEKAVNSTVEFTDTFESASQLPTREYYRKQVDELNKSGAFEECKPQPICESTLELISSSNKDACSLLNTYCAVKGEPQFQYYDYQILQRPNKNKFIVVSELHNRPIFGTLQSSKKDAKKACALRILDQLMAGQKLNCLSDTGRKIKNPDKQPRPLPISVDKITVEQQYLDPNEEMARLCADYYRQKQLQPTDPNMAYFTQDIDLNFTKHADLQQQSINTVPPHYRTDFDNANPVPSDCKDITTFMNVRQHAFRLFCENAFWQQYEMDQQVVEKLNQCGMWNQSWNPVAFVQKCIMHANSWKNAEPDDGEGKQQKEGDASTSTIENLQSIVIDERIAIEQQTKKERPWLSLEYFVFTLPYNPARYACIGLFNSQILHGQISISKSKAKTSCAMVLAAKFVELELVDLEMKPKSKKLPNKKRKIATTSDSGSNEDTQQPKPSTPGGSLTDKQEYQPYQYMLTLHPDEQLDPKTHYFLASHPDKTPSQLLNELTGKQKFGIYYNEERHEESKFTISVRIEPPGIPGLPRTLTGQPCSVQGIPEKNKKLAKLAAARAALNYLIKNGLIQINERAFAIFKLALKAARLCECECTKSDPLAVPGQDEQMATENGEKIAEESKELET